MLSPCHDVNKLLNYWKKYSRLFNKEECVISDTASVDGQTWMLSAV